MARPSSRSRGGAQSLEASLDEENREVLAALDRHPPHSPALKSNSRTSTPPPRVRSMLDVDSPTPRHGSIAGIGVGITSPKQHRKDSSILDPADPSTWTSPHSSKPNSPTLTRTELQGTRPRGASESSPTTSGHVGLPRTQPGANRNFEQNYQFDLSSIPSNAKNDSKRAREGSTSSAMAAALSGDLTNLHVGRPLATTRSHASSGSRSPSGRVKSPVKSPGSDKSSLLSPTSPPAKIVTAKGTVVDGNSHRRLSNKSSSFSTISDDPEAGQGRVPTDKPAEDDAVESDDEERASSGSDDDTRGRNRDQKPTDDPDSPVPDSAKTDDTDQRTPSPTEKRKSPHATSHSQIIKSMLEPSISVTTPSGDKFTQHGTGVHPESNFDKRRMSTSATSVEGDEDDIAKAKTLGLNISPLDTRIVDRHVRMIIRGDWTHFQQEAEAGNRSTRTYLCCSDLSVEANYALEWTVGTIMRDGDTLLAIYAIEDETAGSPGNSKQPEAERAKLHEEGAQAGKAAGDTMAKLTRQTTNQGGEIQSTFVPATEAQTATGSVDARKVSKKEMDRLKAIDAITQSFLKLVRRTTLQVRCMVEVIHCKSPKHLILGAVSLLFHTVRGLGSNVKQVDELEPTLTIVGTRGRSSLRGVLLGSFSNYLVTKSSSPVMVARQKLKKPKSHARIGSNKIRLSNNLMASAAPGKRRSLTQARID